MSPEQISLLSKRARSSVFLVVGISISCVSLVALLLTFRETAGDPIRLGTTEDLRESVKTLLDVYSELTTLITASFGVIAFLITLQKGKAGAVSARAWKLVSIGSTFLLLTLSVSIVGREQIMMMIVHNAVDLNLPSVTLLRWLLYVFLTLSTIFIVSFAFEVTFPHTDQQGARHGQS